MGFVFKESNEKKKKKNQMDYVKKIKFKGIFFTKRLKSKKLNFLKNGHKQFYYSQGVMIFFQNIVFQK